MTVLLRLTVALFVADAAGALSIRPAKSAAVTGRLLCSGFPAAGVQVKLYDHDTLSPDDKMASGYTDMSGNFILEGHAHEISRIQPELNIYHDCNDWWPCQREVTIYVPKWYATNGRVPNRVYNIGIIELSGEFEGESRSCFH